MGFKEALTFDDLAICPGYSEIETRSNCDVSVSLGKGINLKTPIIASPMKTVCEDDMAIALGKLGGLGIIHRFCTLDEQVKMVQETRIQLGQHFNSFLEGNNIGAAIGVNEYEYKERAGALIEAGANVINLDVAHGHHVLSKVAIEYLRKNYPDLHIMSGAVCTRMSIKDLSNWGADSIRCGVGSGSACATRNKTKIGVPQVSALLECCQAADQENVSIISDGGIRMPGDIALALAIGAKGVMLGSILAGTKETPGEIMKEGPWPNERLFKVYMGSASFEAKLERNEQTKNIEGSSMRVPYKGKVKRIVNDINDGVKSSMSYVGAKTINMFQLKARFVKVTSSGIIEATPHGLVKNNF